MRPSSLLLLLVVASCTQPPEPAKAPEVRSYALAEVPESLRPLVEQGDAAILDLQKGLFSRLTNALTQGDPVSAISVCQIEAPKLKDEIAARTRVELGRTSHRLRNPSNAPRAWTTSYVANGSGTKASIAAPIVVDLGDRVGLLRPIPTGPMCVTCHGAKESFSPALIGALAERYPSDQAVGFAEGDLRGWFWAELTK